jgi:hypothetical protein
MWHDISIGKKIRNFDHIDFEIIAFEGRRKSFLDPGTLPGKVSRL